jgi:hypothetical protein
MPAFFFKFTIMSWSIPAQVEKDIIAGKATYRTFQTGNGGQSILPVPANSYAVIFGYDFSPAGGGVKMNYGELAGVVTPFLSLNNSILRPFETQQISFYTGTDFYPFIHHVNSVATHSLGNWNTTAPDNNIAINNSIIEEIDNTPIARQLYITSSNDVTITHGLIINTVAASQNPIPITSRTPQGLTYGGSVQVLNTQTNYGPGVAPQQFMQPSPKDYQDFGFGLLPNNADGQAFATPDIANGLYDSSAYLTNLGAFFGPNFIGAAATNYFLCIHYALYQSTTPETRG